MQLEIKTEGVEFVVSRLPQPKNDADGRQKADRKTGEPLFTTELVAMDDTGAEVIKVTTAGEPKVVKREGVAVRRLVATPWTSTGAGEWRSARTPSPHSPLRPPAVGPRPPRRLGRVRDDHGNAPRRGTARSDLRADRAGPGGGGRGGTGGLPAVAGRVRGV
jgi:predicted deacylase